MDYKDIKRLKIRFKELYDNYHLTGPKWLYWIDYFMNFFILGASLYDYFAYGFYKKRLNGRAEFMTWRKHSWIQKKFNDPTKIMLMRDKEKFNSLFKNYLLRESLELQKTNKEQFVAFFEKYHEIFVKDAYGLCGKKIGVFKDSEVEPVHLYEELKQDTSTKYLIENCMHQHEDIARLHPWSINTIRIVTLYNKTTDDCRIVCAIQRMGNRKHRVDNFHYEGLCAVVDIDTGIITTVGYDKNGTEYVRHPLTDVVIPGFKEPNWSACKDFACMVARMVPEIGYIGWDIVPQQDGTFALIEGNDNADHDVQQVGEKGIWPKYKKLIKEFQ